MSPSLLFKVTNKFNSNFSKFLFRIFEKICVDYGEFEKSRIEMKILTVEQVDLKIT